MNDYLDENIGCLGVIGIWAIVIAIIIIEPFITFGFGFLMGLILKITIGPLMVSGLAAMGITIALKDIPIIWAVLSVISNLFTSKIVSSIRELKNKKSEL